MTFSDGLPMGQASSPGATVDRGAPELRPYQNDASAALCDAFLDQGQNRLLIKKPTGTGKTVWFASLLKHPRLEAWLGQFPKNERRMLVIAHREELLFQAAEKIQKANPGLMVSIEQGDLKANTWSDVVVASIQTLSAMKFRRLHRLLGRMKFRIVVVDECHHAAAATYRTTLVHLGFLPPNDESNQEEIEAVDYDDVAVMEKALQGWDAIAPKDRLLIGCTATPNRTDAIGLSCVFQSIAYSYALKQAIDDGWLVPPRPWVIETKQSLDAVKITAGDFNQKQLAETVNNPARNALAVSGWKEHAEGLSTLAFTVDVQHAHDLAAAFQAHGINARAIHGETPKDERRQVLRDYTAGLVQVITNCMVLTEGTDLPRTSCILHAKPTKSATLYEQMTGRGLRLFPGKTDCVVLDIVDIARRHSLQTAPVLYGLPPGCKTEGELLQELADALEKFKQLNPGFDLEAAFKDGVLTLAQLNARATAIDPWAIPALPESFGRHDLNWMAVAKDVFRLQYPWADGTETLSIQPDVLGKWDISCELRSHVTHERRQRTIAMGIPSAQSAVKIAEAFVRQDRRTATRVLDLTAPWRLNPPSPKQSALARKLRIPVKRGFNAGQVSDLIDLAFARNRRR